MRKKLRFYFHDMICFTCYSLVYIFGIDKDWIRKVYVKSSAKIHTEWIHEDERGDSDA